MADILKYLPPVIGDTYEFKEIAKAENPELNLLWDSTNRVLAEWFLDTMSEYGISRTEKMLGIKPFDTDTLEDRRFRLKARYNHETPYTYRSLRKMLDNLCGGNYKLSLKDFVLDVKIGLSARKQFTEIIKLLEKVVPVNIVINASVLYNTHEVLSNFTHEQLSKETHEQLRSEEKGI